MLKDAKARRVIAAGTIGNVLEWYDFAIYGYFAAQIGRQFFPREDPLSQTLAAFGVFAVGYLMRPLGGVVVGHIGDRFGRRAALTFSIAAMAIPTVLIGVLPSYDSIGLAAPVLLTLLRMMQGLAVGGEYASSMIFMIEQAPQGKRGLMGGLAGASATLGTLLGSVVGAVFAANMSTETLEEWGWRLPFLAGLAVGLIGYMIRRHIPESTSPVERQKLPIVETVQQHWTVVLRFIGISFFHAGTFYIILVYLVTWVQVFNGTSPSRALEINSISMAGTLLAALISGYMSDKIGRRPLMLFACAFVLLLAIPLFWLMHGAMLWYGQPHFMIGQLLFAVLLGFYYGSLPAMLVELAPRSVRCTCVALGYNLSYGLLGGLAPLVAVWLIGRSGYPAAPAVWIMVCACVTLLTLLRTPETHKWKT